MDLQLIANFLIDNQRAILEIVGTVFTIAWAIKQKMTARQTVALVINTLKDEDKMDGDQFTPETTAKLEAVAEEIGVIGKAVVEAKRGLEATNSGTKIGSLKGKPIYLEDVLKKASVIGGIVGSFKR